MASAGSFKLFIPKRSIIYIFLFTAFSASGQYNDTVKYKIVTADKSAFYSAYDISDTAIQSVINKFLYLYTYIDTTENGSYANSKIIYNSNGLLTVYREGNYDYWQDSTWIGFYSETLTIKTRTGDPVRYDDLFKRKDTTALRNLVWSRIDTDYSFVDKKKEMYRITEDEFRISNEGVYFEIGLNCGRGPCLEAEQPVIVQFDKLKRHFRKGGLLK
jgi:hypothetical protein